MFALLLRLKRRIRRLLKVQTESRQTGAPTARSRTLKYVMLMAASVLIGIFYPGEVLYDPLDVPRAGEFAREDIVAEFPITIYKSEREVREGQQRVRQSTMYVLDNDSTVIVGALNRLSTFVNLIKDLRRTDSTLVETDFTQLVDSVARRFPKLSQTAINRTLREPIDLDTVRYHIRNIYRQQIYSTGVILSLDQVPESPNPLVSIRRGDNETSVDRSRILDVSLANARLTTALNQLAVRKPIDVDLYYHIGRNFIAPNLTINLSEYEARVTRGLEQLTDVKEVVPKGEVIVFARSKVSRAQEEVLQEMVRIMRSQAASRSWVLALLPAVARVVLVLAAFMALYSFFYLFRQEVYRSNPKLLAIFLVFALQMLLVYLARLFNLSTEYIYPIAVLPVMITILFDAEMGVLSTVVLALLLGIMHRFSFTVVLLTSVVGIVACFSSRRVRKRSEFYRIMISVVLAYILLIGVVENFKLSPNVDLLYDMLYGSVTGVLSIFLVMGLLPVFESLFGITTDTTLLELSDLNHPLLKRLSIEAPGTYHHSISVGNLSEAAAEAIGANSLLARVGTYYHDIGKIEIPEYFVENQFSIKSKHDMITPGMSAMILASHVKKGRLLGEEADIPDDVLNFIEEHHGTMVMSYFWNKAQEQGADDSQKDKYRYPGPRPQTRETGIAMLADAVEAASRTLDAPKPARIDSLIQRIINDRFQSGELNECPLTLRDLARIKQAFAQVLIAVFHHRVKYPTRESGDPS